MPRLSALPLLLALVLAGAACQGDAPPPPAASPSAALEPEPGTIRLMGTGAMEPLARALAAAYKEAGGAEQIVVEPSVGSGGGVQAAADGAADLGLISRALAGAEKRHGLVVRPVARDAVVIAAHRSVRVDGLTRAELVALYAGRTTELGGERVVVLLRDAGESANGALERVIPEMTALREDAYRTGRLRVLYHDDAMGVALATTPGGLGVFDLGAVVTWHLPLKTLALDGVVPSVDTLADGRWKLTRELAFVLRPDRRARVERFLAFVSSAEGRKVTRAGGYLPLEERAP